jgi:hypothetical protein
MENLADQIYSKAVSYFSEEKAEWKISELTSILCQLILDEVVPEPPESVASDPDHLKGMWDERRDIRKTMSFVIQDLQKKS